VDHDPDLQNLPDTVSTLAANPANGKTYCAKIPTICLRGDDAGCFAGSLVLVVRFGLVNIQPQS
jgi:hypothetical protein